MIQHHANAAKWPTKADWGTPGWLVRAAEKALGIDRLDVDLCSSDEANKTVLARRYGTAEKPVIVTRRDVVWCNLPSPWGTSGKPGPASKFWTQFQTAHRGAFLFFNEDYMRHVTLRIGDVVCILRKSVKYVGAIGGATFTSVLLVRGCTDEAPLHEIGLVLHV